MVFGDNVRARTAARALPRTPPTRETEEEEEDKTRQDSKTTHTLPHTTHTAIPPHTNHHHYSTMTQPCHKHTTLNQQCCDSEHKDRSGKRKRIAEQDIAHHHTPSHFPTCNTQHEKEQDNARGTGQRRMGNTMKRAGTTQRRGTTTTHHSRHSTGTLDKLEGDANTQTGGHHRSTRPSMLCHPTSSCHPPPNDSPTHLHEWGESNRRIPHHTNTTDRHTPTHHSTWQQDSSMT